MKKYKIKSLPKAQVGIEKEQYLDPAYVYSTEKKRKKFGDVMDQLKAFGNTFAGKIISKENRYPDRSMQSIQQYIQDVKEYQKQAAEYQKARRLVKQKKMSTDSFADRYERNNWARFDKNVRRNTAEEQAELEDAWYGTPDEQGRRYWMDDPRNVAQVAKVVAGAAPLAPLAIAAAPTIMTAMGAVLGNPLVQAGLTGYGVYDATTNSIPEAYKDFSEGRYLEGLGNTAMAALDLAPIPVFGTNLLDEAVDAVKYSKDLINKGKGLGKYKTSVPKSSGASRSLSDYSSELENIGGYTVLDDVMKKHIRAMERQKPGYTNKWFKGHTKSPLERRKEPWEKMYGTPDNVFSNFRKPEIGDFEFKPMSEGWNAMQPMQLRLQGIKGPDIPDVSRSPWRKIDDMDLNPQRISPEKYQEYGLDPEEFAFGKLKGERPLTDPNFLENLKAAKQRALDQGNYQMANMYDDLIKRKQKEALESFTEPYTGQQAFKEVKYNMAGDLDIDNAIDWANPNKEAHEIISKTITDVRENKLKNWSSDEGKKRLQAMIDETPWLRDNGITPENYIDSIAGMDDQNLNYLNNLRNLDEAVSKQLVLDSQVEQGLITRDDWFTKTSQLDDEIKNIEKSLLSNRSELNEHGPFNAYMSGRKPVDWDAMARRPIKIDDQGNPVFDYKPIFKEAPFERHRIGIGEGTNPKDLKQVIEHEIGHLLQKGAQTNLDKELENLSLKGDDLFTNIKSEEDVGKTGWSEFKQSPEYFGKSKKYFQTGSEGQEKLPFLLEVRQDMLEKGVIKDMYQEITPRMMQTHYNNYMKGSFKGDKTIPLRIFDIMENKKSNFNLLSKVINKAPVILPVAGAAGVLSTMGNDTEYKEPFSTFRPQYQAGGSIETELTPEEIQWYTDNGYVVEEI